MHISDGIVAFRAHRAFGRQRFYQCFAGQNYCGTQVRLRPKHASVCCMIEPITAAIVITPFALEKMECRVRDTHADSYNAQVCATQDHNQSS